MLNIVVAASFQNINETNNVTIDISTWIFEAVTHACLSCQVANPVELLGFEKLIDLLLVFQVHANKGIRRIFGAHHLFMPVLSIT